ncbi:hypothetical protein D3C81_1542960 [compost metagenome]
MYQLGQCLLVVTVPGIPCCAQVHIARQVQWRAVKIARQVAPCSGGIEVSVLQAGGQRGTRAEVGFQYAVEHLAIFMARFLEEVFRVIHCDNPSAQSTGFIQGSGDVRFEATTIPRSERQCGRTLEFAGWTFAHHIDGGGWIARAAQHAGRAAQDFDAIQYRGIRLYEDGAALIDGEAVDLQGIDLETAREVSHAFAVGIVDGDARRVLQHIGQVKQDAVFH